MKKDLSPSIYPSIHTDSFSLCGASKIHFKQPAIQFHHDPSLYSYVKCNATKQNAKSLIFQLLGKKASPGIDVSFDVRVKKGNLSEDGLH